MSDPKQDVAEALPATQNSAAQAVVPGKIRLRHPHTGEVKEVDATPTAMIPIMGLGYQQVKE